MSTPSRVFVTGALGFIGRTLSDHFTAAGAEVRGVDVTADPVRGVVAGDIAEAGAWQDHVAGCDLVVHTAAIVSMTSGMERFWRVNVAGTRRVLDAAVGAGAARVVHVSSVVTFGTAFPDQVDESWPVRPTGVPYGDTKIASEQVVLQAHAEGQVPCTIVRPGDVYGPGSRPWTILPVEQLRARGFILPAGGRGIFSPVYIDDLVAGMALAGTTDAAAGQVLTISGGAGVTTREFFGHYCRMLGMSRVPTAPGGAVKALAGGMELVARARRRDTEVNRTAVEYLAARRGTYSIDKARRLLGWAPEVGLDEGMRRTEAWLRERGMLGGSAG